MDRADDSHAAEALMSLAAFSSPAPPGTATTAATPSPGTPCPPGGTRAVRSESQVGDSVPRVQQTDDGETSDRETGDCESDNDETNDGGTDDGETEGNKHDGSDNEEGRPKRVEVDVSIAKVFPSSKALSKQDDDGDDPDVIVTNNYGYMFFTYAEEPWPKSVSWDALRPTMESEFNALRVKAESSKQAAINALKTKITQLENLKKQGTTEIDNPALPKKTPSKTTAKKSATTPTASKTPSNQGKTKRSSNGNQRAAASGPDADLPAKVPIDQVLQQLRAEVEAKEQENVCVAQTAKWSWWEAFMLLERCEESEIATSAELKSLAALEKTKKGEKSTADSATRLKASGLVERMRVNSYRDVAISAISERVDVLIKAFNKCKSQWGTGAPHIDLTELGIKLTSVFKDVTWSQPGRRSDQYAKGGGAMSAAEKRVQETVLEGITSSRQTRTEDLFETVKDAQRGGKKKFKKRELPDEDEAPPTASKRSRKRGDASDEEAENVAALRDDAFSGESSKPRARAAKAAQEETDEFQDRLLGVLEANQQHVSSLVGALRAVAPSAPRQDDLREMRAQLSGLGQRLDTLTNTVEALVGVFQRVQPQPNQQQQQQPFLPAPGYGAPGYGAQFGTYGH